MSKEIKKAENILMDTLTEVSKSRELSDLEAKLNAVFWTVNESENISEQNKDEIAETIRSLIEKVKKL